MKRRWLPGPLRLDSSSELSLADYLTHVFKGWYGYCLILALKLADYLLLVIVAV